MRSRVTKEQKPKSKKKPIYIMSSIVTVFIIAFFLTYNVRVWLAGTLLTTQHRHWAKWTLVGTDKIDEMLQDIGHPDIVDSEPVVAPLPSPDSNSETQPTPTESPAGPVVKEFKVEVEEIAKRTNGSIPFKGHIMKITDPNRVHLVPTIVKQSRGKDRGEWISEFSERTKAIGGINASGFNDPDQRNWAAKPMGLVIVDGKLIQNYNPKTGETALGITFDGQLITGSYSAQELLDMGIRDAMSFRPQLIVNGKSLFPKENAAWGYQPRSAVGQTADGTILFVQIDGRRTESVGASMKDVADIMLEHGAVNAMAMDGGTSAFMVYNNEILTVSPVEDKRGRFLPNAWMVY